MVQQICAADFQVGDIISKLNLTVTKVIRRDSRLNHVKLGLSNDTVSDWLHDGDVYEIVARSIPASQNS